MLTEKFPPPQKKPVNVVPTPATSAGGDVKPNVADIEIKSEKGESIKSEKIEDVRGIKREASGSARPGSAMEHNKKMKFS